MTTLLGLAIKRGGYAGSTKLPKVIGFRHDKKERVVARKGRLLGERGAAG
jgi:hypothetical protein